MQFTILGGTGRTGKHIVELAIKYGHEVKILARTPTKIDINNENLAIVKGNALILDDMIESMKGSDAVISTIGATKNTPKNIMEQSALNIIKAMEETGIERLVYLTGAGVRSEHDQPGLVDKIFGFLLKLFSGDILEDSIKGVNNIKKSNLRWTIVRVPRLVDGKAKGRIKEGYVGDISSSINRRDLADFMLKETIKENWVQKMPAVSN